jgi:hypothetical protein
MKFRFVARDHGAASLVEAGIDDFTVLTLPSAQSVEAPAAGAPVAFAVEQNQPNPFNPSTEIAYTVPRATPLSVRIYDADGRLVRTLVERVVESGAHGDVGWSRRAGAPVLRGSTTTGSWWVSRPRGRCAGQVSAMGRRATASIAAFSPDSVCRRRSRLTAFSP